MPLCLFSQGGVLHVVNGPFSSGAQGFTYSLNSGTVLQHWKPDLVRSSSTQVRMILIGYLFFINFECELTIIPCCRVYEESTFNIPF